MIRLFMIQKAQVTDDLRELQGCIYAFLDHKAVHARLVQRTLIIKAV